jgi:hypothetical protein
LNFLGSRLAIGEGQKRGCIENDLTHRPLLRPPRGVQ